MSDPIDIPAAVDEPPLTMDQLLEAMAGCARNNADGNINHRDLDWLAGLIRHRGFKP